MRAPRLLALTRSWLAACDSPSTCTPSLCSDGGGVLHTFMGTDVGYFCFLDATDGGCGDTDPTRRPYSTRRELTSIDGVRSTYCMPPATTTCQGIGDTQSSTCTTDSDCGVEGLDDGYCPTDGPGAGACTYTCGGDFDCRESLSCGDTPPHCRPRP